MVTIVVAERDFGMRALLGEWLVDEGYAVEFIDSLADAAAFEGRPVAACLVDVPNLHQYLNAQQAMSLPWSRLGAQGVPVIGMSTQLDETAAGGAGLAKSLGFALLLPKPCERARMVASLNAVAFRHPAE